MVKKTRETMDIFKMMYNHDENVKSGILVNYLTTTKKQDVKE